MVKRLNLIILPPGQSSGLASSWLTLPLLVMMFFNEFPGMSVVWFWFFFHQTLLRTRLYSRRRTVRAGMFAGSCPATTLVPLIRVVSLFQDYRPWICWFGLWQAIGTWCRVCQESGNLCKWWASDAAHSISVVNSRSRMMLLLIK